MDREAIRQAAEAAIDQWQIDTHWWGDPLPSFHIAEAVTDAAVPELLADNDRLRTAVMEAITILDDWYSPGADRIRVLLGEDTNE